MNSKKMIEGSPLKLIFWFSLPLMLGNVFQQLYTVVDTAIVGQTLGVNMLAALGAADWLCWLAFSVLTAFPQGFSILIAQAYGANDNDEVNRCLVALVQNSVLVTVVLVALGVAAIMPLLHILNTPSEIINYSQTYLRIIYLGLPVTMFYNACASILRAFGNSKTPLYAMIVSAVINIVLDFVFIIEFKMGVEGAAIATVIAQLFAGLYCYIILRQHSAIDHSNSYMKWNWSLNLEMFKIGAPMSLQNVLISIAHP